MLIFIYVGCTLFNASNKKYNEYNIYAVNGTLPTLIVGLDLVENNETPGFLWYAREGTFDKNVITKYMPNLVLSKNIGSYSSLHTILSAEMKEYVENILKEDPNAHFNLIVDEYRNWLEFPVLLELGLKDDQYSVRYYSDGTLSYVTEYDLLKENSYNLFEKEKENYYSIIQATREGKNKCDPKCMYLINEELDTPKGLMDYSYDANYVLLATLRDNVEYYLQYPNLLEFKDDKIKDKMKNSNIKKLVVKEKFDNLSDEKKNMFFEIVSLDKKTFDANYFNSEGNKYLVITGANPFYGNIIPSKYYGIIDEIVSKYGNEYKILYKPHPSAIPEGDIRSILNSKGIDILPGKMPMEAITFVYDDLKLGGFPSSLYMNVEAENTLFFFSDSKETLVSPLNKLYDKLFINAEIMS